jgi:dipeptidyl aminopeptidase/acylaminoacyl peptidase
VRSSPSRAPGLRLATAAAAGLALVVALAGQTRPQTQSPPPLPSPPREGLVADEAPLGPPTKVDFLSRGNRLTGFLFEPAARAAREGARVPVIVYNHGSERDPDLVWLGDVGRFYQSHGFAVLFPWRQGCSGSGGTLWSERFPLAGGDEADLAVREGRNIRALEDELVDVLAAVEYARSLPMVDKAKVYVGGSSFGGLLALMAAGASSTLKGAVACSGAAWTYKGNTARGQHKLEELARGARVPVFFMQAENDYNPGSSEALGETMRLAGLPHLAKIYPRFGSTQLEGHAGFCNRGSSSWGADVLKFLEVE